MDKKEIIKEYEHDDITIVWKPRKCIHAAICVSKLPEVYKPNDKPWINPENAKSKELIEQIDACPSGALSYKLKNTNNDTNINTKTMEESKVAGTSPVIVGLEAGQGYAWCACGKSSKQPYCDGSHAGSGITPVVFKAVENKQAALCMCKKSANAPYCDGAHAKL